MRKRSAWLIWLVLLFLPTPAPAQEPARDPWIGQRVVTKFGAVLKVDDTVVDDEDRAAFVRESGKDHRDVRTYRVEHVNGEWLWLHAENRGVAGWVQAKYVLSLDQAIDTLTERIRSDPRAILFNERGLVWSARQEYDKSIADYDKAIQLEPTNAIFFNNRGGVWKRKRNYDQAITDYNEAIRLDPNYAMSYRNRGIAWGNKQDHDQAIRDYSEAIRISPSFALAYYERGYAWHDKQDYDRAIRDYGEAVRLNPNFALAYYERGNAWHDKQDYDQAIRDYSEAVRLNPGDASSLGERGTAWRHKRQYDRAMADFAAAIRLDRDDAYPRNGQAWCWATCPDPKYRDGTRAIESATEACRLTDWKKADYLDTLASAYAEAGDFTRAVEWQKKANALFASAEDRQQGQERLKLYQDQKPYRETD